MMDQSAQRELARLLAALRREGRQQSGLDPRLVPPDKATAYRVARMVEEELGWPVVGWKIAAQKEEMQRQLRTDSPIYGRVYCDQDASPLSVERAKQCSPIPEVEYQAVLGADLPPRDKPYSVEEVTDAVASLHPGLELAECRFVHDARFPPLPAVLADGSGSGTILHGAAIEDWRRRDIAGQEVTCCCATACHDGAARRARRARPPHGAVDLARQRAVAHRYRHEGRPDDQHRHLDRHAGAEGGRDLHRRFRAVRQRDADLHLIPCT